MNFQTAIIGIIAIIMAAAIGSTFIKTTARPFANNPSESYKGESVRQKASQQAEDTAERQRRMMENMRERMERNRH